MSSHSGCGLFHNHLFLEREKRQTLYSSLTQARLKSVSLHSVERFVGLRALIPLSVFGPDPPPELSAPDATLRVVKRRVSCVFRIFVRFLHGKRFCSSAWL